MTDIIRLKAHVKEHKVLGILKKEGKRCFSPDWIVWEGDHLEFIEVKMKQKFVAGSNFNKDGHGLDFFQFKNYLDCFQRLKIRTKLIIFDEEDDVIYWQHIDELAKCKKNQVYVTPNKRIIIFALELYNKGVQDGTGKMG